MLQFILILFALCAWVATFSYFWRGAIFSWLDNRFGKDPALKYPDDEEDGIGHAAELFASPKKTEEGAPKPEDTTAHTTSTPQ
ncbi:hypothetical protein [Acetobacter cibinongensis]|uniref:Uncharacterized protein n=1 Tax=Acetobacter cibinongensis TaxID=146475 RepID=A0A1Z5YU32_9PROT|nr:hypothetical protein [Acetobacter cibinongensis]OUJ02026.1 hypothetical protein HK14_07520 [Acetobacter cibinongensis]